MLGYILGTMLLAGIFGGLINSYLSDPQVEKPLAQWQHVVVGIGAAFMVPVFLNTISSHLIAEITGPELTSDILSKLLILAGFCLLAAVSSRAFIRSMTDRLLREVADVRKEAQAAKDQADRAAAIANLAVEPDSPPPATTRALLGGGEGPGGTAIGDTERQVLTALAHSRYAMRSVSGIAQDTGLARPTVESTLAELADKSLVTEGQDRNGQPRWYATAQGLQVQQGN